MKAQTQRVVTVTPAGRARNLEVLVPYLLRNRGLACEHHFWINTRNGDDVEYIRRVCGAWPGYFRCVDIPFGVPDGPSTIHAWYSLREYCDPETVFVRIDDDICWMAEDCLYNLVQFRLANPEYFLVYANTINNAVCAFLHQRAGVLPYKGHITCDGRCAGNAWSDERFTRLQHEMLIERIERGATGDYKRAFERWVLLDVEQDYQWQEGEPYWCEPGRCSVNFISWLGRDFGRIREAVQQGRDEVVNEERYLAYDYPRASGRRNCILGSALAAHFSFISQAHFMYDSGLLERYRSLSRRISPEPAPAGSLQ
jgi:hypothetical protein